ncbi:unnamed protein product [Cyprideis torosa]|uniref:Uncharacterized protein n=1 Tax=Cyprideis torosa TaxID=163714 RepID=A0A7R8WK41_9CRUS|nr:unnamed protein product [Cyprideis torosa]CAG0900929.1 unnamed protein product [Cyprideis torosa]
MVSQCPTRSSMPLSEHLFLSNLTTVLPFVSPLLVFIALSMTFPRNGITNIYDRMAQSFPIRPLSASISRARAAALSRWGVHPKRDNAQVNEVGSPQGCQQLPPTIQLW